MAGLRKPGESPSPSPRPRPADEVDEVEEPTEAQPAQPTEATGATEAAEAESSEAGSAGDGTTEPEPEPEPDGEVKESAAKPSPRAKHRSAGTGKPAAADDVAEFVAPGTPPKRLSEAHSSGKPKRSLSRRGSYILAAVLVVLAGLFSTGAVLAKQQYSQVASATDNAALLDVAKTEQVKKAMKQAAERLFSYDYRDIAKTEKAAKELLASKEVQHTYTTLMGEVKRLAPKQQIVVTVTATEAAVVELHDNKAKVMVYVDQTATRTKTGQSSGGGAALWFKAELKDGKWKVVGLDTYSSGAPLKTGKQQGGKSSAPKPSGSQQPSAPPQGN